MKDHMNQAELDRMHDRAVAARELKATLESFASAMIWVMLPVKTLSIDERSRFWAYVGWDKAVEMHAIAMSDAWEHELRCSWLRLSIAERSRFWAYVSSLDYDELQAAVKADDRSCDERTSILMAELNYRNSE